MALKLSIISTWARLPVSAMPRLTAGKKVDLRGSHWSLVDSVINDLGEGMAFFRSLPAGQEHSVEGRHAIVSADTGRSRAYAQPDYRRAQF